MGLFIGILLVISCVLGGFLLGQGQLLALWQPHELLIIGGAAIGSFFISNPVVVVKVTIYELFKLLFYGKQTKLFYLDLFLLLFSLGTKIKRAGLLSIEDDIEMPQESTMFARCPQILMDRHLMGFIVDTMRIMIAGNIAINELEVLLDNEITLLTEEFAQPGEAINTVADALPAFGIVAAVLGIVITMQSLNGDPTVLGAKVAAALVGTFLGVLLSYGLVGPIGNALGNQANNKVKNYSCIKNFLLALAAGAAPKMAVEHARRTVPVAMRPGFLEVEEHIKLLSNYSNDTDHGQ